MKPGFFLAALCLLLSVQIQTALAADAPPSVDAIIEKHITAIGGKAAVEKIKSRSVKAEFSINENSSPYLEWSKAPSKRAWQLDIADWGVAAEVLEGTNSWRKDPNGLRELKGDELARALREGDLHRDIKLKALYPNLTYKRAAKHEGADVHVLESKTTPTSVERLSFDAKSGLLVRQEAELILNGANFKTEASLADYKEVDGVKIPHKRIVRFEGENGDLEFTLQVKEVKHNLEIDEAKFKKPSA
jgi:hypothetical protein